MVDRIRPIKQRFGRPRRRPDKLHGDKGHDYNDCRARPHQRAIVHRTARKSIESSQRLGRHRQVVERTFSRLTGYRRLSPRYERHSANSPGMDTLAATLTCFNRLMKGTNTPTPDTVSVPPP